MRIQPNAPDPREISTERASTSSSTANAAGRTRTEANVTGDLVSLKSLMAQTMQFPEVRQERVEKLKEMIASGRYQVNAKEIADAILNG